MNAYELAKDIEEGQFTDANYNKSKTANWLRQQADRIVELEKFKSEIDAENKKLFEAALKANEAWDKATGRKP